MTLPRLSVWLIRTALLHLAAGTTLGMLLLANKGVPLGAWVWPLLPWHIECVLVGWTVQLAMGVAFWILPRIDKSRGNESPVRFAYLLLNGGVVAAALGAAPAAPPVLFAAGRLAQCLAVVSFAAHAWPRVRAAGSGSGAARVSGR